MLAIYSPKKKKGAGRCSSAPAKFTVIGKFFVGGKSIEGRMGGTGLEGRGGRRAKAPSYKILKLLCLSYEFPSITNGGEFKEGTGKRRQRRDSSNSPRLHIP